MYVFRWMIFCVIAVAIVAFASKNTMPQVFNNRIDTAAPREHIVCRVPSRSIAFNTRNKQAVGNAATDKEMVFIKGGSFKMGSNDFPDAQPLHTVTVNSFWMDEHEVTNAAFAAFVKATGYQTVAERKWRCPEDGGN